MAGLDPRPSRFGKSNGKPEAKTALDVPFIIFLEVPAKAGTHRSEARAAENRSLPPQRPQKSRLASRLKAGHGVMGLVTVAPQGGRRRPIRPRKGALKRQKVPLVALSKTMSRLSWPPTAKLVVARSPFGIGTNPRMRPRGSICRMPSSRAAAIYRLPLTS